MTSSTEVNLNASTRTLLHIALKVLREVVRRGESYLSSAVTDVTEVIERDQHGRR